VVRAVQASPSSAAPSPTIAVSSAAAQTVSAFGASGAWWPNDLGDFPRVVQKRVADLLFSKRGIRLSSYRYNIGGGGVGVTNPTRAPETFLVRPGIYDWSRDPGGMRFLRLAKDEGVPVLVGFVNSAPPQWTTNGLSCGGQLVSGAEAAYAKYLADVVRHLAVADGITLSYLSPMNEPDNAFGSCGQEGMAVPVSQRATLVQALGRELAGRGLHTGVIADESSLAFVQFLPEVPQWLSVPGTAQWVAALAHHAYEFPTDALAAQVATLGPRFQKPLWMTEICCYDGNGPFVGFGAQYDPTMVSGLWLADTIWQDLAVTGDAAFDWWTAVSPQLGCAPLAEPSCAGTLNPNGWNDGLLYYDPNFRSDGNDSIYATKRYWVMGNFSRYVRPGAVRHEVEGVPAKLRAIAFADGENWSVIVINDAAPGAPPTSLRIALPGKRRGFHATGAVQTSATRDLAPVRPPRPRVGDTFVTQVPSQSVTTFSFKTRRR
jgi:O-glycosyl hydrolase